jgi:hypothetical protein
MADSHPDPAILYPAVADPEPADDDAESLHPWDCDPPADAPLGPDGRRVRHDAFTPRRRHDFLKALVKTGCLADACRLAGVGPRTVYRHQEEDPAFAEHCRLALRMSAAPVELTAWARAVEGVEQEFACGGQVHVRRRYDAGLLRLLLQGSNPKKYGPRPGFTRKRLLKEEKKQVERRIRAEIAAGRRSPEEINESILARLERIALHEEQASLAAGWTKTPDGILIPPGYGLLPGHEPPAAAALEGETPRDSL